MAESTPIVLGETYAVFVNVDGQHFGSIPLTAEQAASIDQTQIAILTWFITEKDAAEAHCRALRDEDGNRYFQIEFVINDEVQTAIAYSFKGTVQ